MYFSRFGIVLVICMSLHLYSADSACQYVYWTVLLYSAVLSLYLSLNRPYLV